MKAASLLLPLLAVSAATAAPLEKKAGTSPAMKTPFDVLREIGYQSPKQQAAPKDAHILAAQAAAATPVGPTACTTDCNSTLNFKNAAAQQYQVGNNIPGIPFKTRTSWAGEMPLANAELLGIPLAKYFFWLWGYEGNGAKEPSDSLVVWLQGGPGCSSLSGMLQEVGPIQYVDVGSTPQPNNYSWTLAADMLFPEQPLGVGFDQGIPTAQNEDDVANAFMGFLDSFYATFDGMQAKKLYIAAESYGGMYGPYISNALIKAGSKYNFQGLMVVDGVITSETLLEDVVTYQFVVDNAKTLEFNSTDIEKIRQDAESCGYIDYVNDNLNYPPKGKLPPYNTDGCNTFNDYYSIAQSKRSSFNIYKIDDTDTAANVLGDPNSNTQYLTPTFYDNTDLQNYIHAPHKKWNVCNSGVFPTGDHSPPPDSNGVLQNVIEKSPAQRTVIIEGLKDGLILSNGTSLALQNLTWNGAQGFSQSPYTNVLVGSDGSDVGNYTTERGLLYALVTDAGHEVPEYVPPAGFTLIQYLLGQRSL